MQVTRILTKRFAENLDSFKPFEKAPLFAVALSGGADSMALCLLAKNYAQKNNGRIIALVVNHNLRPNALYEAEKTAQWCAQNDIFCEILTIDNPPETRIEENARKMRYELLFDACKRHNCLYLLTGHHAQDLAETVLMRQHHKSKTAGLSGFSVCESFEFGWLLRPLSGFYPEELRAFNKEQGITWFEDETNTDETFERARLRKKITRKEIENALSIAGKSAVLRIQNEKETADFLAKNVLFDASGVVFFKKRILFKTDKTDWLGHLLRFVGQKPYLPSSDSLNALFEKMREETFKGASLGGCFISPLAKGQLYICPEINNMPEPKFISEAEHISFGMFDFSLNKPFTGMIRALGNEKPDEKIKIALPKRCFKILPAFFDKQGLFLVPHLGYKRKGIMYEMTFKTRRPAGRNVYFVFNRAVKSE